MILAEGKRANPRKSLFEVDIVFHWFLAPTCFHFASPNPQKTRLGGFFGRLESVLEASWGVLERLGPSWSVLEASWRRLGASWARLGAFRAQLRGAARVRRGCGAGADGVQVLQGQPIS